MSRLFDLARRRAQSQPLQRGGNDKRRRLTRSHIRLQFEKLETRSLMASDLIISEFLAANSGGLLDSDGESNDWIEIYNPTNAAVNLNGWHLTDNSGDMNAWTFPTVNMNPNDFLVVFASGKNRAVAGSELHTNFKLSSSGEYLALTHPNGSVAYQFNPAYPVQATNVSYGTRFDSHTWVTTGSAGKTLIPTSNTLGNTWQQTGFDDSSWVPTPVGVGFGVVEPGFDLQYVKSNVDVNDVDSAISILNTPASQTFSISTRTPYVNYMGNGGGGHYANDFPFPTQTIGDDINDFIIKATSSITIPTAGNWTFGVNSDDGFRLTLTRNNVNYVVEYPGQRGPSDTLGTLQLPDVGEYSATLVMFERAGGASVEMFAAPGSFSSWDDTNFDMIGDTANGGLAVSTQINAGPSSPLRTDIRNAMLNVNSSAYVRLPFDVSDSTGIDSMRLRMRYDDGFVAYLNGVEVVRRNAPTSLAYNSAATVDLTPAQAMVTEDINLGAFVSVLHNGNNVLAIQGLNSSASDDSFLILPELVTSQIFPSDIRFFDQPTPGAPNGVASLGIVDRAIASTPAGFYVTPQSVTLSTGTTGATIRYTLDGSAPTETNGTVYTAPVIVSSTSTLRAFAYRAGYVSLPSITRSYIFIDDVIHQSETGSPPAGWPSSWGSNVVDYGMDPDVLALEGPAVIKSALKAIPSFSISTDLSNLFDPTTGIYSHSYNDGRDWERPASFELINPDGSAGFQVNVGLRIRGGYSRSTDNPKHSFRLFFRGEYGDSSLDFPLFGASSPSTSFKKLDLRTAQNYSWSFGGDPSNNFVADIFNRLSQRDMGQPYSRGEWYHLYIDGQYWGLYETDERTEAEYAAAYFGGLATNYDVIKPEAGPYANYATDGNQDAWYRLWDQVRQNIPNSSIPSVQSNDAYMKLQGKNLDGTDNQNFEVLLDVDNLVDYMINILYGGNLDAPISNFLGNTRVNNYFVIRDRTSRVGFKYLLHDSEHTLRDVNENRNGPWPAGDVFDYFNPQWLHQRLMANDEYRMRFADLTEKFLFYDGAMSVAKAQARFMSEANKIDQAIYAESARWGDAKRPDSPLRRSDWVNAVTGVVGGYLPQRGNIVIQQFRNTTLNGTIPAPLFPSIDAPTFIVNGNNLHGGSVTPYSLLRFGATTGLVYYTLDGSDPRLFGGSINPNALTYDPQATTSYLFTSGTTWKYRDKGTDLGSAWRASNYDDSVWAAGNAELGYGDGDESTVVSYGPDPNNKYITTYFRKNFNVTNIDGITGLKLRLKRDDGAVVYINGVEAARSNMPTGTITASTLAASSVTGTDESTFFDFQLNPGLLVAGNNVIAIEIHQAAANSSDISLDADLQVTRQNSTAVNLGVEPKSIQARVQTSSGEWSALEQATFSVPLVPASSANLRVTEIHYNPAAYTGPGSTQAPFNDPQNFEFIELRNISEDVISLDGVYFLGITYTFPTSASGPVTWLLPGQSIVVLKNQQAFAARYLTTGSPYLGIKIAPGDYGTSYLSNGGEEIAVYANGGILIQDFVYDDTGANWPSVTDGGGPSLTVLKTDPTLYNNPLNWRASFVTDGTPGIEENDTPTNLALSANTVPENQPGILVGTLSTTDYDDRDTFTYSIVAGSDGALFAVVGNELRVGTVGLDYEQAHTRSVKIRTMDAAGAFLERLFTINVTDVNEPVVLTRTLSTVIGSVLTNLTNSGTWNDPELGTVTLVASVGTVTKNTDGTWVWNYTPSAAFNGQVVTITAHDGTQASTTTFSASAMVDISKKSVYYKGSSFANTSVDAALDTSKNVIRSGASSQTLGYANLINDTRGINGLVFDIPGLVGTSLTSADVIFRMSPTGLFNESQNPPSSWATAPTPSAIAVAAGTSTQAARVRVEWANNAIANRWLQIRFAANANTGLLNPQTFYIGHLQGEVNGQIVGGGFFVTTQDQTAVLPLGVASVTSTRDLDKNGFVTTQDITAARLSIQASRSLRVITIPVAGSGSEGESDDWNSDVPSTAAPIPERQSDDLLDTVSIVTARWTDRDYSVLQSHVNFASSVQFGVNYSSSLTKPSQSAESSNDAASMDMLSLDEYFVRLGRKLFASR